MRTFLLALALLGAGCTADDTTAVPEAEDPVVSDNYFGVSNAYTRAAPSGGVSAVFLQIENTTAQPDTLVAVRTDASDDVEMHETITTPDSLRRMQPTDAIPVPAGTTVTLEPGALHIMLLDLTRDLTKGDTLLVEFEFSERGTLIARAPIQGLAP